MVKVANMSIPPEYSALLAKILAYFDQLMYPTWATRNFHLTRSARKANAEKTVLPKVSDAWKLLSDSQKLDWKNAVGYTGYNKYQLFSADFCYRRKAGLTLPGTPSTTHQMFGLKISNPGGSNNVYIHLHFKDLIGPLQIDFYYKKVEYIPPADKSFNLTATAIYFDGGLNIEEKKTWESPTGNISWTPVSLNWGISGRKYFHLIIEFSLNNYDADVFLDNFKITDYNGAFFTDSFNKKSGKEWVYKPFYRKQGWAFYPSMEVPFFEVVYLDQ